MEEKKSFRDALDEMVRGVPRNGMLFIRENFNGHIRFSSRGYDDMHRGFFFCVRNKGKVVVLNFAWALELMLVI